MIIKTETPISRFQFWSGAVSNASKLTWEELDQLGDFLDDLYPDGITDVELNDLMWFEFETVCDWIGLEYDPYKDQVIRPGDEEDEDDESDEDDDEDDEGDN